MSLALTAGSIGASHAQVTGPVPGTPKQDLQRQDSPRTAPPKADAAPKDESRAPGETTARAKLPRDKRTQLDALFEALKLAPDESSASAVADRLDALLSETNSTAGDLLMARANAAAEAKKYDLSLALLDQVVEIEPDSVAGFSRRATIYYLQDDYTAALADIREVLAREPRHTTMLMGFAMILRELGDEPRALEAVRKALAVNPHLASAKELEGQLAVKVDGRGI
ncbi:tetratricopeptide repeat protein [Azorhizobium oxalatiphilum]|uniref:tetratricopeptide repeat protein n=1 Tax=Azorhizobium oxalatiphilum TaxID=980631 RepID=UPI001FCE6203|nr:tetratricopeptide repeat protein [Azorhizobium oxalatiphilum]